MLPEDQCSGMGGSVGPGWGGICWTRLATACGSLPAAPRGEQRTAPTGRSSGCCAPGLVVAGGLEDRGVLSQCGESQDEMKVCSPSEMQPESESVRLDLAFLGLTHSWVLVSHMVCKVVA